MSTDELTANPQLDETVVHDLNREPRLPFDDTSFDAVLCAVSVQYLQRPVAVFAEVARVLRPGGIVAVTFSNRCFPTKAVAIWLQTTDAAHGDLVRSYLVATRRFRRDQHQPTQPARWRSTVRRDRSGNAKYGQYPLITSR